MKKDNSKTRQYSGKRLKAIELLAQGGLTHQEVADACHVAPRTLSTWKTKPDFVEAIISRSRELIKAQLPDIYKALGKKATLGSHQHIKILLDHLDKVEEMSTRVASNSITFVWNDGANADSD